MAKFKDRLSSNVPGAFYVDRSCIDCGTCRLLALGTFDDYEELARVHSQPRDPATRIRALMSVLACPVGAIGTTEKVDYRPIEAIFPEPVDGPVHYCGYHSSKSFGAASYLILRPEGNILVDTPRYAKPLLDQIEALGGVDLLFLTHADDVADHAKFQKHFGCRRIIHETDASGVPAEILLKGEEPVRLDEDVTLVPVPGHTEGSVCLIFREIYLFSGDHLSWSPERKGLQAFRRSCWHSWKNQIASMERLARFPFEWVLPGHGARCHFPRQRMTEEIALCIAGMKTA